MKPLLSIERLNHVAEATGFRTEILEKAIHLLNLLERLQSHPFLKGKLALKGGTALNLFLFDMPRLSVDIDLNYVGQSVRDAMLEERPKLEKAIAAVCSREGFSIRRAPEEHAGGKWELRHQSAMGGQANLQLDLNYMFRIPLWPLSARDSRALGPYKASKIPLLDIHELAAGKLAALFARRTSRDLFDAHRILTAGVLDRIRLRTAFVVYGAANRRDWRAISIDDLEFNPSVVLNHLAPMIRRTFVEAELSANWAARLLKETQAALECILPLSGAELEFLGGILDHGEIQPSLITDDKRLAARIRRHPMLAWKALNVREHKR